MGDKRCDDPSTDRHLHPVLARRMSDDPQQALGALLARLEVRERQIAVEAEAAHEQIAQLTALRDGLAQAAEHITITRKTLLELPDETPSAPAPPTPALPGGPAYSRSRPCSPKPTLRYGRGTCARQWTWTSCRTTSTTSASN